MLLAQAFNRIIQCTDKPELPFSLLKVTVNLVYFCLIYFASKCSLASLTASREISFVGVLFSVCLFSFLA